MKCSETDIINAMQKRYMDMMKTLDAEYFAQTEQVPVAHGNYITNVLGKRHGVSAMSLFKLINLLKIDYHRDFSVTQLIKAPFRFVTIHEGVLSYEKAKEIAQREHLDMSSTERQDAWLYDFLLRKCMALYVGTTRVERAFRDEFGDEAVLDESLYRARNGLVTHARLHALEISMGDTLLTHFASKRPAFRMDPYEVRGLIGKEDGGLALTKTQQRAIKSVLCDNRINLICGFPGSGKSTIVQRIIRIAKEKETRVLVMAPTGMAVRNLSQGVEIDSKRPYDCMFGTLHKAMFDLVHKIPNDSLPQLVVVDEFSMVDTLMFHSVMNMCVRFDASLLLVADMNQLPPISAGYPLEAIRESEYVDTFELTAIKRQGKGVLKKAIKAMSIGKTVLRNDFDTVSLVHARCDTASAEALRASIEDLLDNNDLNKHNVRFISPQYKHNEGVTHLNRMLSAIFRAREPTHPTPVPLPFRWSKEYNTIVCVGDMVVRTVNDYQGKALRANGDIGTVEFYGNKGGQRTVSVRYEDGVLEDLLPDVFYSEFALAYAMTVHKMQGSQIEHVVVVMGENHRYSWVDTRDAKRLLYTAISRARKRCVVLGEVRLFEMAQRITSSKRPSLFLEEFDKAWSISV